jgi:hypothetical protein
MQQTMAEKLPRKIRPKPMKKEASMFSPGPLIWSGNEGCKILFLIIHAFFMELIIEINFTTHGKSKKLGWSFWKILPSAGKVK